MQDCYSLWYANFRSRETKFPKLTKMKWLCFLFIHFRKKFQMCVSVTAKATKFIFQLQFACKADYCLLIPSGMPHQIVRSGCVSSFKRKTLSCEVTLSLAPFRKVKPCSMQINTWLFSEDWLILMWPKKQVFLWHPTSSLLGLHFHCLGLNYKDPCNRLPGKREKENPTRSADKDVH